jgi:hypothetical protein
MLTLEPFLPNLGLWRLTLDPWRFIFLAVKAHPGALEARSGAVEAPSGAVEAHPGALHAHLEP